MKYISGIHALNLRCGLDTCGDWHASGIQWKNLTIRESSLSVFGDYGIEDNSSVPEHPGTHKVANHIRAILDLVAEGAFGYAQGMKNELICNDTYTPEVFSKLLLLKDSSRWTQINEFVGQEYGSSWLDFLRDHDCGYPTAPIFSRNWKISNLIERNDPNEFAVTTAMKYQGKPTLQDLCDLMNIVNHSFDRLSHPTKAMLRDVFSYKGKEQFEYLLATQWEPGSDKDRLVKDFFLMHEKLGLLIDKEK